MKTEIRLALRAVLIARTAANGGLRVVYPFLPAIARGLGVSIPALSSVIALRNLGGLVTPLTARAAEIIGRRKLMIASMGAIVAGCLLTASSSAFIVAATGILVVGIAVPAFGVAMQAWFGDRVPYEERGRVLGITEFTWSLALIVTVPLSGFLIVLTNWRAPFALIALLSAVGLFAIISGLESDTPSRRAPRPLRLNTPRALVLACAFLFSAAAEIPFIVYGQWLEGSFGLTVAGIGIYTLVIVVAEVVGEGLVVVIADRVGLKRMILGGLGLSAIAYASLGVTGSSLILATVVVTIWIAAFEVTVVATIPFVSELAIESRDRLLSLLTVCIALGRAGGAIVAQPIYASGGITRVGVVAATCSLLAAMMIVRIAEPATGAGLTPT
jgi:MFS transporter, DHA1 family, inner membrane transport protein